MTNLDEAYERLHRTGPEFEGWLSNHGPMAADALGRMGHDDEVGRWVDGYAPGLEERPAQRWLIEEDEWRDLLGDASRLGDWLAFFERAVTEEPWRDLLTRWWPRLLPGAAASATHCLIRTGHAVRALGEADTGPRLAELGQALGYFAARWQAMPSPVPPRGQLDAAAAFDRLPAPAALAGGYRAQARALEDDQEWRAAAAGLAPVSVPSEVPAALDRLTDVGVTGYLRWRNAGSIMLIHAATAPRAAALVIPALPDSLWIPTYETAWDVAAVIGSLYRRTGSPEATAVGHTHLDPAEVAASATHHGDEHVIKFAEVALESHRRGNAAALSAAEAAVVNVARQ